LAASASSTFLCALSIGPSIPQPLFTGKRAAIFAKAQAYFEPKLREGVCSLIKRGNFMLRTILLIILILALLGSVPLWPYSAGWGYGPSGGAGLLLIILIILIVVGRI
jgi:hypothetical protein